LKTEAFWNIAPCSLVASGRSEKEIAGRIDSAKYVFNMKRKLFTFKNISLRIRNNVVRPHVWSIVCYVWK
jgi:hypothetical protein